MIFREQNHNSAIVEARRSRNRHKILFVLALTFFNQVLGQSIGYQPNLNYGFNPYMSPVHGYGLGLPYGSNGLYGLKHPWLTYQSLWGSPFASLASKIHSKNILKKYGSYSYGGYNPYYGQSGGKYTSSYGPYSYNYGYGAHYGSAQVPNNPYKGTYGDYYTSSNSYKTTAALTDPQPYYESGPIGSVPDYQVDKHALIKPLIKAGALLTTAAIIGKKKFDMIPPRLDPSGMILHSVESKFSKR